MVNRQSELTTMTCKSKSMYAKSCYRKTRQLFWWPQAKEIRLICTLVGWSYPWLRVIKARDLIFMQPQCKAHMTNWSGRNCNMWVQYCWFYIVFCDYIIVWMSSVACELYVGHKSVVFICCSAVSASTSSDLCTLLLVTVHVRTEERQTKSDMTQRIAYHRRTLKLSAGR